MKQIPQSTKVRYDAQLFQHHIPKKLHPYYLKWLRFYLDFCRKYNFKESEKESLPHFIKKLKAKKQTDQQQNQAFDAISIFLEIGPANKDKTAPFKVQQDTKPYSVEKQQITNAGWMSVHNDLKAENQHQALLPKHTKNIYRMGQTVAEFYQEQRPSSVARFRCKRFSDPSCCRAQGSCFYPESSV